MYIKRDKDLLPVGMRRSKKTRFNLKRQKNLK